METSQVKTRARVKIEGRVQGVYFRASAVTEARRLSLTGWVMNCPDGTVEAVAEGLRSEIEALIAWCHQGPPGAIVREVYIHWEKATDEFNTFRIRR
jgi:acylphosphatase